MWLYKFTLTAEKAIIAEFNCQNLTIDKKKAKFVQFLLGDLNDILSKDCPFIWKTAYDTDEDNDQHRLEVCHCAWPLVVHLSHNFFCLSQGLFQGHLVTQTFFEHLSATAPVDKDCKPNERPIGALIISI